MELRHLRYLLAVVEHRNFTRAAEALRVSQPTLSQQIRQLEKELGAQLLDRSGRGVVLTDTGEAFARYARRAMRELAAGERAVLDVQDLSRGGLRLGLTPSFSPYLIGPLVARLRERHPAIRFTIRELTQDRIEAELLTDELDVGIAFGGPHLPGIADRILYQEPIGPVVAEGHPLADRADPLPLRALAAHPLALLASDFATRRHVDAHLIAHHVHPDVVVEANSIYALVEVVRRTGLVTVLPHPEGHDVYPHLRPVAVTPAWEPRPVTLLTRAAGYRSAATRAFSALAEEWAATLAPLRAP